MEIDIVTLEGSFTVNKATHIHSTQPSYSKRGKLSKHALLLWITKPEALGPLQRSKRLWVEWWRVRKMTKTACQESKEIEIEAWGKSWQKRGRQSQLETVMWHVKEPEFYPLSSKALCIIFTVETDSTEGRAGGRSVVCSRDQWTSSINRKMRTFTS